MKVGNKWVKPYKDGSELDRYIKRLEQNDIDYDFDDFTTPTTIIITTDYCEITFSRWYGKQLEVRIIRDNNHDYVHYLLRRFLRFFTI